MIHSAADEVLEHLWYAAEEHRTVCSVDDLRLGGAVRDEDVGDALASLRTEGLVQDLRLTAAGERRAKAIVRRHRLAEMLFVHAFGSPLHEAEVSACEMEHMLSEAVTNRVCTFLGHPPACPHGKPIPQSDCCRVYSTRIEPIITRLTDVPVGTTASIAYIAPKSSARIERLATFGIIAGSEVTLTARKPSCVISSGGTSVAVDDEIGNDIYVSR
jgi:DtxR family transcriptional regulator, Mn-dependent transcriptional regulator